MKRFLFRSASVKFSERNFEEYNKPNKNYLESTRFESEQENYSIRECGEQYPLGVMFNNTMLYNCKTL